MAYPAQDGQQFTNRMAMNSHNASLKGMGKQPAQPKAQPDQGPKPLEQNPDAMRLVDQLKQMGYTGEDVERAMGQEEQPGGEEATSAAPMMIPGMR